MSHMLYLSDFKSLFSNNLAIVKAYISIDGMFLAEDNC